MYSLYSKYPENELGGLIAMEMLLWTEEFMLIDS